MKVQNQNPNKRIWCDKGNAVQINREMDHFKKGVWEKLAEHMAINKSDPCLNQSTKALRNTWDHF